jgi:hypothetical protein
MGHLAQQNEMLFTRMNQESGRRKHLFIRETAVDSSRYDEGLILLWRFGNTSSQNS